MTPAKDLTPDKATAEPAPVEVVNAEPLAVKLVAAETRAAEAIRAAPKKPADYVQRQSEDPSLPARTTFQQDLVAAGQRNINVMWEGTQRNIALMVSCVALSAIGYLIIAPGVPNDLRLMAFTTLTNVFFAVTSVYFTRTNHTKVGGVIEGDNGR